MSASFDFEAPDLFTAGTVGPPGQRVFYLQARESGALATLRVEKEQIGGLAEYLARLLEKLPGEESGVAGDLALVEPIAAAWAVAALGVGYDEEAGRIVVVAHELRDDEEGEGATARFHVNRAQAAAFVERARALVAAGRPSCQLCGRPKNPEGHVCVRSNGHAPD